MQFIMLHWLHNKSLIDKTMTVTNRTMIVDELEVTEAREYAKGTPVKLRSKPDRLYIVDEYDPMMVPPIWLVNDPMPHYPHELDRIVDLFCPLKGISQTVKKAAAQLQTA